jgi:hypothetical protein
VVLTSRRLLGLERARQPGAIRDPFFNICDVQRGEQLVLERTEDVVGCRGSRTAGTSTLS